MPLRSLLVLSLDLGLVKCGGTGSVAVSALREGNLRVGGREQGQEQQDLQQYSRTRAGLEQGQRRGRAGVEQNKQ